MSVKKSNSWYFHSKSLASCRQRIHRARIMRSLTPTRVRLSSLVGLTNDGHASNVAIDPETDCLYLTVERPGPEGGVEVDIVRLEQQSTSKHRGVGENTCVYTVLTGRRSLRPSRRLYLPRSLSRLEHRSPSTSSISPMIARWSSCWLAETLPHCSWKARTETLHL